MKKKSIKPLLIALSVAVLLIVLILLLPRIPNSEVAHEHLEHAETEFVIGDLEADAINSLNESMQFRINGLMARLNAAESNEAEISILDSIIMTWNYVSKPEMATKYMWEMALKKNTVESWFLVGDSYFNNYREVNDTLKRYMIQRSIDAYNKILEIDPNNPAALNALGVTYVEGAAVLGIPPMKGIGIIKSVLEKDPDNIDALINLGYFAIKSGQFDKAIERFNKVLEVDSTHIEAYLYLTDIYVSSNRNDEAVKALTKYRDHLDDQEKIDQIDQYIKDIKENR